MMSQPVVHNVFFTLKEGGREEIAHLIAQCQEYLTGHPGVEYFSAGGLVEDLDRPVNDREFHVGLHVVFRDRATHDAYQVSERHQAFIEHNKDTWSQVRVFDSSPMA